jgi:hypothetical protein
MADQNGPNGGMDKNIIYTVVGIVVVLLIVWAVYAQTHKNGSSQNASQNTSQSSSGSNANTEPTTTPQTGSKNLSYGDAIKAYPERFQFTGCHGTPNSIAVKKGTAVMLDNRDTVAHTIKADSQTFYLPKLSYAILHTSVIENVPVLCDGKNSVTLNVEK